MDGTKLKKEEFARFKNQFLGGSFLNDGTCFVEILGMEDFIFWEYIQEKEPYLIPEGVPRLSPVTKGRIILERLGLETSPKRIAVLVQAVYETLAFYSYCPHGNFDSMWQRYIRNLSGIIGSSGFSDLQWRWIEEPEASPRDSTGDRCWYPGRVQVTYVGPDWGIKESRKILVRGFSSKVLEHARALQNREQEKKELKKRDWMDFIKLLLSKLPILRG